MTRSRHQRRRNKRRVAMIVMAAAALALGILIWQMAVSIATQPVTFGSGIQLIRPIEPPAAGYCPGDSMTYPVVVSIHQVPTMAHVAETWCRSGPEGLCLTSVAIDYWLPLLDYREIQGTAVRRIPESLGPGTWELWHGVSNGIVTGYIVRPVEVRACD